MNLSNLLNELRTAVANADPTCDAAMAELTYDHHDTSDDHEDRASDADESAEGGAK